VRRARPGSPGGGDITRSGRFVASFICEEYESDAGGRLTGPLRFRGSPELFTGRLELSADERGSGAFQVSVDLEGGFRDVFGGIWRRRRDNTSDAWSLSRPTACAGVGGAGRC
jgi:hypothetical protein